MFWDLNEYTTIDTKYVTSYLWRISKPWLILGSHVSATWGVLDPEGIPQLLVSSECLANLKFKKKNKWWSRFHEFLP